MKRWMLVVLVTLCTAAIAHADTFALGQASTAGFTQGAGIGQTPRGWDFQVNAPGIEVTSLAVNAATSIPITLTLWNIASQTELAQATVNSTANTWSTVSLLTPVFLTQGASYSVIGWADTTSSPNAWYLFNNSPSSAFTPTGTIQYLQSRFENSISANAFPTSTIPGQYGVTDIGYRSVTAVPEPASLLLLGTGLIGLAGKLRRKRA